MSPARLAQARLDAFFAAIATPAPPTAARVADAFASYLLALDGELMPSAARRMWRTLLSDYLELEPSFDMATAASMECIAEWPRKRLERFLEELHAIRHVIDHAARGTPDRVDPAD